MHKLIQKLTLSASVLGLALGIVLPAASASAANPIHQIHNEGTKGCMSVSNWGSGAPIVQQPCNSANEKQRWLFASTGMIDPENGYVISQIKSYHHTGWCVAIEGGSNSIGARLVLWPCQNNANFHFSTVSVGFTSKIRAQHSGQFLQVNGASTSPGAVISQWIDTGANHFKWYRTTVTP
jgi:hypothetical protein